MDEATKAFVEMTTLKNRLENGQVPDEEWDQTRNEYIKAASRVLAYHGAFPNFDIPLRSSEMQRLLGDYDEVIQARLRGEPASGQMLSNALRARDMFDFLPDPTLEVGELSQEEQRRAEIVRRGMKAYIEHRLGRTNLDDPRLANLSAYPSAYNLAGRMIGDLSDSRMRAIAKILDTPVMHTFQTIGGWQALKQAEEEVGRELTPDERAAVTFRYLLNVYSGAAARAGMDYLFPEEGAAVPPSTNLQEYGFAQPDSLGASPDTLSRSPTRPKSVLEQTWDEVQSSIEEGTLEVP
ncbi:MAG: hypothetical protein GF355_08510 [Candidatus Eisenbacteria bacterium]|nr:hypothetical protein [Candidatus Eisenbacteria bacterium]